MPRACRAWATPALLLALASSPPIAPAADYEVGPGLAMATPGDVPWESLGPGDRVLIRWRPEPYRDKWVVGRRGTAKRPILIRGLPGPDGQPPVIDGRGATTRPALNYWNEARSILKIGGSNRPADTLPAHVVEGLELRGARPPFSFTGRDGEAPYAKNAAAIHIEKGEHITIRNCILRDCGNGLFVGPRASDVLVEGCSLSGNGNEGSAYEHNSYTEASGITFQFNRYGPLRAGCPGNNLKDRSAGTVIRYNWIEGGNRQLDLVDGAGEAHIRDDPAYRSTFVYGNVLIEREGDGNNQVVHYGGDSRRTEGYRKGTLFFYHNTVVSRRAGTTTLFRLSTADERVDCRDNLIFAPPGANLVLLADSGTVALGRNWLPAGWRVSLGPSPGAVLGGDSVLTGRSPGFVAPEDEDYRLAPGSPCIDAGAPLPPEALPGHDVTRQYVPHRRGEPRPRLGAPDLGAFEHAGPPNRSH